MRTPGRGSELSRGSQAATAVPRQSRKYSNCSRLTVLLRPQVRNYSLTRLWWIVVGAMALATQQYRGSGGERVGGTVRAEEGSLPLATIIPTSARWLIYNNLVRAKPVGSIAQRPEFRSGILMSILREQRGGGTCDRFVLCPTLFGTSG